MLKISRKHSPLPLWNSNRKRPRRSRRHPRRLTFRFREECSVFGIVHAQQPLITDREGEASGRRIETVVPLPTCEST
jgi:hypothetical protein